MDFSEKLSTADVPVIYANFNSPVTRFDCGEKCSPYNEKGIPFCCDIGHAVPSVYQAEWQHLQANTDLWNLLEQTNPGEANRLKKQTPEGHLLVACKGHSFCQRNYRSLTCRAFPFFPYFTSKSKFIGLSYYHEYEDRCWLISNLQLVQPQYKQEFINTFDNIFELVPNERENFMHHSSNMREVFCSSKRSIPLLHRNGLTYKISPSSEKMRRVQVETLPMFGPYRIAAKLPFPGEIN
jgi:hypothetical protein